MKKGELVKITFNDGRGVNGSTHTPDAGVRTHAGTHTHGNRVKKTPYNSLNDGETKNHNSPDNSPAPFTVVHDLPLCPHSVTPCRHASRAIIPGPACDLKSRNRIVINRRGALWCNDAGAAIDTLTVCPVTGFKKASQIEHPIQPGQQVLSV